MIENRQGQYKLILASSSPRRKEILDKMNLEFEIVQSDYIENLENSKFSYEKIEELAFNKGKAVFDKLRNAQLSTERLLILSADTVVVVVGKCFNAFDCEQNLLKGKILGKPKNEEDAFKMLKILSGKKHAVVTSVCVIDLQTAKRNILSTTSYVEFEELSDELIKDYIIKFKPLDKAGAYGIQELPNGFVKNIEGSFENIVGLCPKTVEKILKGFTV